MRCSKVSSDFKVAQAPSVTLRVPPSSRRKAFVSPNLFKMPLHLWLCTQTLIVGVTIGCPRAFSERLYGAASGLSAVLAMWEGKSDVAALPQCCYGFAIVMYCAFGAKWCDVFRSSRAKRTSLAKQTSRPKGTSRSAQAEHIVEKSTCLRKCFFL